jgi:Zn-dependent protease with chaperone function
MSQLPSQVDVSGSPGLPVNSLAAAYQPRRVWAAAVSISWNLLLAAAFVAGRGAWRLHVSLAGFARHFALPQDALTVPLYVAILFGGYAILNYPIDLWFGYLEERQFGLAKDGIRAWTRDWLAGVAEHGMLFFLGSSLVMVLQIAAPATWLAWATVALLGLFLATSYFVLQLLPRGLFHVAPADDATRARLAALLTGPQPVSSRSDAVGLPRVLVYSAPNLRDFSGGLVGLADRQAWLVSRSTLTSGSDSLLRFVLLHDLGHRRYHHLLLATLAGWAWVVLGLCVSNVVIIRFSPQSVGHPPYVAWLALCLSAWMAAGEPMLAYLGRRLEYQADRFYLRNGGTIDEMRTALEELSRRNLARTEDLRRRHTIFHPLPSVWNRLHAARQFDARARARAGQRERSDA